MIDKAAYPTVGRIVLYNDAESVEPFPAVVVAANAGRYTIPHLAVFLHDGLRTVQDVKHKDCVKLAPGEAYWDWMEYQKGQAAKTEALQAELDAKMTAAKDPHKNEREMDKRGDLHTKPHLGPGGPARALALDYDRYKNESSTPSPVDGKR